jgi:hypothetical protein
MEENSYSSNFRASQSRNTTTHRSTSVIVVEEKSITMDRSLDFGLDKTKSVNDFSQT